MNVDDATPMQLVTMFAARAKMAVDMMSWQLDPSQVHHIAPIIASFSIRALYRKTLTPETINFVEELGKMHDQISRKICLINNFSADGIKLDIKYCRPYRGIGYIETAIVAQSSVLTHTLIFMSRLPK